jgi:AcrR family transcriptional regulator
MDGPPEARSRRGRKPALDAETEIQILLDAGLTVLRRSGYERATLDEVLAESGLSTRSLYRHFETKDDLLRAVYRRDAEAAIAQVVNSVASASTSLEGLEHWVHELLSFAFDPGRSHRAQVLGFRGRRTAEGLVAEYERSTELFLAPLISVLERGKTDGTFPNADPVVDAQVINALVATVVDYANAFRRPKLARQDAANYVMQWASGKLRR